MRRLPTTFEAGAAGLAVERKSGRVVAAHVTRTITEDEAHYLRKRAVEARDDILYEQYERNAIVEDQMHRLAMSRAYASENIE